MFTTYVVARPAGRSDVVVADDSLVSIVDFDSAELAVNDLVVIHLMSTLKIKHRSDWCVNFTAGCSLPY